MPVSKANLTTVIKIGAARQAQNRQKRVDRMRGFQGVNQHRLLPIAQELQVDAQVFF